MVVSISYWIILIVLIVYVLPTVLCLVLIKQKNYKKLPSKKRYAGFWWRIFAGLIDNIILAIVSTAISFMGAPYLGFFIYWLYFVILQSSEKRSTFGMRACGIKIHDEHFNRLSFLRLTGRYFCNRIIRNNLIDWIFYDCFHKKKARFARFSCQNYSYNRIEKE